MTGGMDSNVKLWRLPSREVKGTGDVLQCPAREGFYKAPHGQRPFQCRTSTCSRMNRRHRCS
jgi:hypothetical protein